MNEVSKAAHHSSLAQLLLKLTAPGVPDLYQGTELWDLSLVDPDNRRPVDYELRRDMLAQVVDAAPEQVLEQSDDGAPKIFLTHRALRVRTSRPQSFDRHSTYLPLYAKGPKARHAVAYRRGDDVVVVAPRLLVTLGRWDDTALDLPEGTWRNELTNDQHAGHVALEGLLARFPVALLVKV